MRGEDSRATALLAKVDSGILAHVQDLFRTASRHIRARMVNRAGVDVPVRLAMCELGTFGSVVDRLQNQEGGAFGRITFQPDDVPGLLVLQGPVLFRLVGLLLGEDPKGKPPMYQWRSLTRLDLRIAQRVAGEILEGMSDSWPGNNKVRAVLDSVTGNPRVAVPLERTAMVIEAALDFGPPEDPFGLATLVMPAQVASRFLTKEPRRTHERPGDREAGVRRVMTVPVTLVAELARLRLPMGQIRSFAPGQIIELGPLRDAEVKVGGRTVFLAEPGEKDGVRSVRVKRRVEGQPR